MNDHTEDRRERSAEDLLADCLALSQSEWSQAVRDACVARPDLAGPLDQLFENVRAIDSVLKRLDDPPDQGALGPGCMIGDYELIERVGGGGMGIVYRAIQRSLNRTVALKLIRPELLRLEKSKERFRRETESISRLHDPGIVPLFEAGEDCGIPFFTMEFIEGQSVANVLDVLRFRDATRLRAADFGLAYLQTVPNLETLPTEGVFSALEQKSWAALCCRIVARAARALDHAHQNGVIHRDVKPSNLMVTGGGRVILVDFGLAVADGASSLTRTGSHPGSLPYMAPEQLSGQRVDERTDVYSLGVTLCELLTLRCPFPLTNHELARKHIVAGSFDRPRLRNRAVSLEIEAVCLKAMDRDPSRRYQSAAAFADDLVSAVFHRPLVAKSFSWPRRALRMMQRHPARTLACAGLFLSLVVSPITLVAMHQRHADERKLHASAAVDIAKQADKAAAEAETMGEFLEGLTATLDQIGPIDVRERLRNVLLTSYGEVEQRLSRFPTRHIQVLTCIVQLLSRMNFQADALKYATSGINLQSALPQDSGWAVVPLLVWLANDSTPAVSHDLSLRATALSEAAPLHLRNWLICISQAAMSRAYYMHLDYVAAESACRLAVTRAMAETQNTGSDAASLRRWRVRTAMYQCSLAELLNTTGRSRAARSTALDLLNQCREWFGNDDPDLIHAFSALDEIDTSSVDVTSPRWAAEALRVTSKALPWTHPFVLKARMMNVKADALRGGSSSLLMDIDCLLRDIERVYGSSDDRYMSVLQIKTSALETIGRVAEAEGLASQIITFYSNMDVARGGASSIPLLHASITRARCRLKLNDSGGYVDAARAALLSEQGYSASAVCSSAMVLSAFQERGGEADAAISTLRRAQSSVLVATGSSSRWYIDVSWALGSRLWRGGKLGEGERLLRECALTVDQGETASKWMKALILRDLGDLYLTSGRLTEAADMYGHALGLDLAWGQPLEPVTAADEMRLSVIQAMCAPLRHDVGARESLSALCHYTDAVPSESVLIDWIQLYAQGLQTEAMDGMRSRMNELNADSRTPVPLACIWLLFAQAAADNGEWGAAEDCAASAISLLEMSRPRPEWLSSLCEIVLARCIAIGDDTDRAKTVLEHIAERATGNSEDGWALVAVSAQKAIRKLSEQAGK